jgi:hypothetical protein
MSPLTNRVLRGVLSLLFGGAGLWMIREAVRAAERRARWEREGVVVEGEIIRFKEEASTDPSDQRPLYAPVVTFRHADGKMREFTSATSNRPNPYTVGQRIAVRYIGGGLPGEAELDSAARSVLSVVVLITLAVVFLGCALLPILMPMPAGK